MRKKTLKEIKEFLDVVKEDYEDQGNYKDVVAKIDDWRDEIQNELEGIVVIPLRLKKKKR